MYKICKYVQWPQKYVPIALCAFLCNKYTKICKICKHEIHIQNMQNMHPLLATITAAADTQRLIWNLRKYDMTDIIYTTIPLWYLWFHTNMIQRISLLSGIILFHTFDIIVCTMISLFMVSKWKYDVICKNPDSIVQKKMLSSIIMYDIIS